MKSPVFICLCLGSSFVFGQALATPFPLPVADIKSVTEWGMDTAIKEEKENGSGGKSAAKPAFELVSSFEYDTSLNLVRSRSTGAKSETEHVFSYGKSGLLEREQTFSGDGPPVTLHYEYDSSGKVVAVSVTENGKLSFTRELRRSDSGREVLILIHAADGTLREAERSVRDDTDRTVVSSKFDAEGGLISETVLCHDNSGRLTRLAVSGDEPSWTEWQYSGEGKLVSVTEKTPDGLSFVSVTRYGYDERGLLVETRTERYDGNPDSRMRHSYKVDSRGNWIFREDFSIESKFGTEYAVSVRSVKRDIVYRR